MLFRRTQLLAPSFFMLGMLANFSAVGTPGPATAVPPKSYSISSPSEAAKQALDVIKSIQADQTGFLNNHTGLKQDFQTLEDAATALANADGTSTETAAEEKLINNFGQALDTAIELTQQIGARTGASAVVQNNASDVASRLEHYRSAYVQSKEAADPAPAASDAPPLSRNILNSMVIIEGDLGSGSGFIAKMHDEFFIVTNQHVLSGNAKFTVTGIDGTKYPTTGPLFGAVDSDVAILRIPTADNFIAIEDNSDADAQVNDGVVVLGNAEGGGVATQTAGKLLGIGPKLVEVDAKFVHGNSGSPIIDSATHKVVGIATYVRQVKPDVLQQAANAPELHWFGYRLDTIKQWEQLDWKRFCSEGQQLAKAQALTDAFINFAQQTHTKTINLIHVNDDQINDAVAAFMREAQSAAKVGNRHDLVDAEVRFTTVLSGLLNDDVSVLADQKLYSFHANELKNIMAIRNSMKQSLLDVTTRLFSTLE